MCHYIHGEIVVVGNGEISQFAQVHVPSSDSIHNEDVRGETQGATCRLEVEKGKKLQKQQHGSVNTGWVEGM